MYYLKQVTPAQIREAEKSLKIMEGMIEAMTPGVLPLTICFFCSGCQDIPQLLPNIKLACKNAKWDPTNDVRERNDLILKISSFNSSS